MNLLEVFLFMVGIVFLFFVPGYNIIRQQKKDCIETLAISFVISSAILLGIALLLTITIGMNWFSLVVGVGGVTLLTSKEVISAFRLANPL